MVCICCQCQVKVVTLGTLVYVPVCSTLGFYDGVFVLTKANLLAFLSSFRKIKEHRQCANYVHTQHSDFVSALLSPLNLTRSKLLTLFKSNEVTALHAKASKTQNLNCILRQCDGSESINVTQQYRRKSWSKQYADCVKIHV